MGQAARLAPKGLQMLKMSSARLAGCKAKGRALPIHLGARLHQPGCAHLKRKTNRCKAGLPWRMAMASEACLGIPAPEQRATRAKMAQKSSALPRFCMKMCENV